MILKILLLIAVITAVYFFFIKKKPNKVNNNKENKKPKANDMVECESCGVYCEIGDMILSNGKYYCSEECVKKG